MKANDLGPPMEDPQGPPSAPEKDQVRSSWWTAERIRAVGWSIALILGALLGRRLL